MIPAFFFIDPFKFTVPFELNKGLLEKYNNVELLFNLMTEELSRFFEVDKINQSLKILYGIEDTSTIKNEIKDKKGKERINVITDFYKKRLLEVGALYTLNFDIQRETGHYKMSLVYATKNINGFDTMKDVLNKLSSEETSDFEYLVDKSGGQTHLVFYPKEEIIIKELADLSKDNSYGITLISLNEEFRKKMEPGSAPYLDRINSLKKLHDKGCKTWVSIEPYPTPNIIDQDFEEILNSISFVDKIIFGRLHYNKLVSQYKGYKEYYNNLANQVIKFCEERNIEYHIKEKTITEMQNA